MTTTHEEKIASTKDVTILSGRGVRTRRARSSSSVTAIPTAGSTSGPAINSPMADSPSTRSISGDAAGQDAKVTGFICESFAFRVLIMHGTEDRSTVCLGSEFFHETAGSSDMTLKIFVGRFHDLLNDIGKEGVMADIKAWIDARITTA